MRVHGNELLSCLFFFSLVQTCLRGCRSSVIASNIVGLCRGYAKQLVNDCGVVIQGESPGELPERMLCCVSLNRIDVGVRRKLHDM